MSYNGYGTEGLFSVSCFCGQSHLRPSRIIRLFVCLHCHSCNSWWGVRWTGRQVGWFYFSNWAIDQHAQVCLSPWACTWRTAETYTFICRVTSTSPFICLSTWIQIQLLLDYLYLLYNPSEEVFDYSYD